MVKSFLNFLVIFLMLATFACARNDDSKLKNEFGPDLTHAPFFLRFSFLKEYSKDWKNSNYTERKSFLTHYENNVAAALAKEKADAKALALKNKERAREKRDLERKIAQRKKDQEAEDKAEAKAVAERNKNMSNMVYNQQKDLAEMQRQLQQEQQAQH